MRASSFAVSVVRHYDARPVLPRYQAAPNWLSWMVTSYPVERGKVHAATAVLAPVWVAVLRQHRAGFKYPASRSCICSLLGTIYDPPSFVRDETL